MQKLFLFSTSNFCLLLLCLDEMEFARRPTETCNIEAAIKVNVSTLTIFKVENKKFCLPPKVMGVGVWQSAGKQVSLEAS